MISHVATYIHRQTVEIGLEQVLRVDPRHSRGQVGLQFCAEGLAKGKQCDVVKVYCCEACAFEAQRGVDCGGRSDSTTAPSVVKLNEVESSIVGFYQAEGIESPGVTPADLARVIAGD